MKDNLYMLRDMWTDRMDAYTQVVSQVIVMRVALNYFQPLWQSTRNVMLDLQLRDATSGSGVSGLMTTPRSIVGVFQFV